MQNEYMIEDNKGDLSTYAVTIVVSLIIAFLLRAFVFQLYYIPSGSMESTLRVDDKVLTLKLHGEIERGDIVVFKDPGGWLEGYPDGDDKLIKRVIGVSGDHVQCCNADGKLLLNGDALDESYLAKGEEPSDKDFDVTVKEGYLWVMGDNRNNSSDSRYNEVSQVPVKNVVGVATMKLYPELSTLD